MSEKYETPEVRKDGFHCPNCGMFAKQNWEPLQTYLGPGSGRKQFLDGQIGLCQNCTEYTIWAGEKMLYPDGNSAPLPHQDMPKEVESDYLDARAVVDSSPRAAAALLRLAMEKLTDRLLEGGTNQSLHHNIGDLVDQGRIDDRIQQALDSVRVTGNDMVHAGEIYEDDDKETSIRLFKLVNIIVRTTITDERLIEEAYEEIPENKTEGIENRDAN